MGEICGQNGSNNGELRSLAGRRVARIVVALQDETPARQRGCAMLRILGSRKRLCDGLSRRDFLQAGSLGLLGLGAGSSLTQVAAASPAPAGSFGKAKRCILLYLYGAASQIETFDPKPDAPHGFRCEVIRRS